MGFSVRRGSDEVLAALVKGHNDTRRAASVVGSFFHADVTSQTSGDSRSPVATPATVDAANASSAPTSLTLVNQIRQLWIQHRNDDLAHKVSGEATLALSNGVATNLTEAMSLANELKADFNVHIAAATWHYTTDGTNVITSTDASDQTSLNTLANELKTDFNAHIASAPAGSSVKLIDP